MLILRSRLKVFVIESRKAAPSYPQILPYVSVPLSVMCPSFVLPAQISSTQSSQNAGYIIGAICPSNVKKVLRRHK